MSTSTKRALTWVLGAPAAVFGVYLVSLLPPFWDLDMEVHFFVHRTFESDWERDSPLALRISASENPDRSVTMMRPRAKLRRDT